MKHIKHLLIALLLFSCTTPDEFEVDGISYRVLSNNTVKVVTNSKGRFSGNVIIPESVKYGYATYTVTSIGDSAFFGCDALIGITIPNSVTCIGEDAFKGCDSLKTVINLSTLSVNKGSTSNGSVAYYADNVVNVPGGEIVGDYVFSIINGIPTLVSYLGVDSEIVLPDSYNGKSYSIGESAFYNCAGLTNITISNSVTTIGDSAFFDCSSLACITIPNSVTSIGNNAFNDCDVLTSITIPNSVTTIGYDAFYGCDALTSITVSKDNPVYDSRDNCNAIIETATNTIILGCENTVVPDGVKW